VFDCADDWAALMPARRKVFMRLYERIGLEADGISVASERLTSLFPGREVALVRNGVSSEMLREPVRPLPDPPRAIYAGTLSDRFDVDLVQGTLERCPDWRLDLYGQCQYPRQGNRPDDGLRSLLCAFGDRTAWHGPVLRSVLARAIDSSRVCVLPHRRSVTAQGQGGRIPRGRGTDPPAWRGDAMKLYDYAARGRPAVSTRWEDNLLEVGPPHLYVLHTRSFPSAGARTASRPRSEKFTAPGRGRPLTTGRSPPACGSNRVCTLYVTDTVAEFCEAVTATGEEPAHYAAERRAWAEEHAWERRWPQWRAILRGTGPS
jgi:hypothetical protein